MYKIEAVIKPLRLTEVKSALADHGVRGMTVSEIRGFSEEESHVERYRNTECRVDLVPKLMIRVVVADERLTDVVKIIQKAAITGKIGDGSIFVSRIDDVLRIRTGATGLAAL